MRGEGELPGAPHLKEWKKRDLSSLVIPHSNVQSSKELSEATCAHQHKPISFFNSLLYLYLCGYI